MKITKLSYKFLFFVLAIAILLFLFYPKVANVAAPSLSANISKTPLSIKTLTDGLNHPWAMAFLTDGNILITERPGTMRILSKTGKLSDPLANVPAVFHEGQGGLLDVITDPDFANNQVIYFSYAEAGKDDLAGTAVARAVLSPQALEEVTVIFRQQPKKQGDNHFGSRLAIDQQNYLYIGLGERYSYTDEAQQLDSHLGKVIRLHTDGTVPKDNPFVDRAGALPEIWSYGHRNIQGLAVHPKTGKIWLHEHGPRGGDEINILKAGANYGWPEASYGSHYSYIPIKGDHAKQGFVEPIYFWNPSIAPSGMIFYTGDLFADWKHDLFIGALAGQHLSHLALDKTQVTSEKKMLGNLNARIRDVAQGPDGAIYVLTDSEDGKLLKLTPKLND